MTIGIPGWLTGPNSFGVTIGYINFVRDWLGCDDLRILSGDSPVYTDLDLLLLTGGADVNPSRYGEMPSFYTDKPDLIKEYFDVHVLPRYIEDRVPVFGICRGIQSLATVFGGKLHQNMYHETNKAEDPYCSVHNIFVIAEPSKKIKVNSRHHQSVVRPDVDSIIKVLATHSSIRTHIEAIMIQGYPISACQWHPEDLDEDSGVIYAASLINQILKK